MNLVLERCVRRSHLVEEMVEQSQTEGRRPPGAEIEEWIDECVQLAKLLQHAWKTMWEALFAEAVFDFTTAGRVFEKTLNRALDACSHVHSLCTNRPADMATSSQQDVFFASHHELQELAKTFADKWPRFNPARAQQALAEFHRGEYQTIEELLHAAKSGDFQSHQ